jgi:hypothetical protein
MNQMDISRRGLMMLGGGMLGGSMMGCMPLGGATPASAAATATSIDLGGPGVRARTRAKIMGSTAAEDVYTFMRIHFYAYRHEGNLIPLYTMNNLNIRRWSPQPDGSFKAKVFECGTVSKFDTEEPLDEWDNPITGERIKVHHFRGGPLSLTVTKDGSISTGAEATVKPEPLNFQFIDDSVYMLQASAFSYPNKFQPDEWPKESSGAQAYWDSHYIYMAKTNDVADPDTTQAPVYIQLQNMTSWSPWLRMGQIPGRSWGRGFGKKIASVDDIPAFARADLERRHPQIFELDSWTELVDEWGDYKRENSPKSEP